MKDFIFFVNERFYIFCKWKILYYKNPSSTKYKNPSFTKYKNPITKYKNPSFTKNIKIYARDITFNNDLQNLIISRNKTISLYFVDEGFLYFVNKIFCVYFVDKMVLTISILYTPIINTNQIKSIQ
jgi:hypothetical protein